MNISNFRKYAHQVADWMADYYEHIEQYPVLAQVKPKEIYEQIPENPPQRGESFESIFADFQQVIMKGMTHWQHPSFFAYFNANASPPSVLAEMLIATMGAQCMIWQTSPSAAELEERMMEWLAQMCEIPADFHGVIQDTASTATLCALLCARERYTNYQINEKGFANSPRFTAYCSEETHSSIEKDIKIAGLGKENLRKIPTDEAFAMLPEQLEEAIKKDLALGLTPLFVTATIGSTSSTAIDPLRKIGEVCKKYQIWLHVDAAYAGNAMILPEKRYMIDGVELADSYLFNPHKWLLTNFDCTAFYVKDKGNLIRTFEILPEYLKTKNDQVVNNYRDWGIQLGRRFRALKLWFVLRTYGVEGLQNILRTHLQLANYFAEQLFKNPDFELIAPISLNLVCFRYKPAHVQDEQVLEVINKKIMDNLNASGKVFLTHTKLRGIFTLRVVIGQTFVNQSHVDNLLALINAQIEK
ncbi:pyridoxal phosphate-dependent decarboxylase family protein [Thermoflexibacter ruber]|uniref:Aromatic-L-amino-acid decarboxylase n=1 Tax=Thermoflexibacter ruber TaxID=1003 RepID=A0A1I2AE44_9BACT|nr:aminotransferase class I/II-fold pyridoxal phosphate-dependent enzyme [Thermoflexibacter ruber]SFE42284.1 aromatic-L-amino-acid decarboxylase [Thermoflexibacter ruber]